MLSKNISFFEKIDYQGQLGTLILKPKLVPKLNRKKNLVKIIHSCHFFFSDDNFFFLKT